MEQQYEHRVHDGTADQLQWWCSNINTGCLIVWLISWDSGAVTVTKKACWYFWLTPIIK